MAGISWTTVSDLDGVTMLDMGSGLRAIIRSAKQEKCRRIPPTAPANQSRNT
jgi:hypothetical protein